VIIILTAILILFLQIPPGRVIRRQQTITWLQIFTWIITVTAVWVASLTIMSDFGVDITPFLASVGIAGFNCSIGAPTLIKDFIGGFLMLFENQFMIGDTIHLGDLRGTEEGITLRTTYVRDGRWFNYTTPNGQIRI
jgi:small-conductance mechanosensitive channel